MVSLSPNNLSLFIIRKIDKNQAWGYVTQSGTEGNMQGSLVFYDSIVYRKREIS